MAELPTRLPTPPDAVVARLVQEAVCVGSVWFPTRAEVEAWNDAGTPVYVRRIGRDRVEIGPRLGAMWASAFSPVWVGSLTADGAGAVVRWTRRYPSVTVAVIGIWLVLVALWGGALALGIQPAGLPWWVLTAASTVAAPAVGWVRGGKALDAGIPWVAEVMSAPDDEEDW